MNLRQTKARLIVQFARSIAVDMRTKDSAMIHRFMIACGFKDTPTTRKRVERACKELIERYE